MPQLKYNYEWKEENKHQPYPTHLSYPSSARQERQTEENIRGRQKNTSEGTYGWVGIITKKIKFAQNLKSFLKQKWRLDHKLQGTNVKVSTSSYIVIYI